MRATACVLLAAGFSLTAAAAGPGDGAAPLTPAEARGKLIYTSGRSASGEVIQFRLLSAGPRLLPANGIVCASCHGPQGKGGREGFVLMADITQGTLARRVAASAAAKERAAYTDALLARAITEGIDASGRQLDGMMPRWAMQEPDLRDLLQYLKRLGRDDRR